MNTHHQVLIIGGGTAGIMVAAQMLKKDRTIDIGIVEPSDTHYYQPAWTLAGAGTFNYDKTVRSMASVIPQGVNWIKDFVSGVAPETNTVSTKTSGDITYDYLVVAPGIAYDLSLVPGLEEAWDKGVVCSNYTNSKHTWDVVKNFKGGTALFTQPTTPIKCGGAPQKALYMSEDYFQKSGVRNKTNVVFATNGGVIFGVEPIADTLMKVNAKKDINLRFGHQLVKVDGEKQIAWYAIGDNVSEVNHKDIEVSKEGDLVGIHFDMLHTAPPSIAPKFLQGSGLLNKEGWVDVNINSLQHNTYSNIFSLGDVAALPTAKTGAAVRKQAPIVMENIFHLMKKEEASNNSYNGYSSCPLVTGYGKMLLAEFDYQNNFTPDPKLKQLLIKDSSKEHWRLWILKKYMLPYLYWNKMMKGENV
ncbi:MAG: FAD/NAD(P)-binding oxidoreductase [Polaribacter sp.]|nr:FAD/NAD(P)-binding oxidoreductase [Polaribacter sp.]